MSNSLKIGLTGNYLSGLDYVASIFRRYKMPVFDCDLIIKYYIFNSEDHIEKIRDVFGSDVFTNDVVDLDKFNGVDRSTGDLKFHMLLKLFELDIMTNYERWRMKHKKAPYTIFKSQVLFESGLNSNMNLNIYCLKPIKYRAEELHDYFNFNYEDAYKLLESEMDENHKNSFCTHTIHNFENYYVSTEDQISSLHRSLKDKVKDIINPIISPMSAAEYV
jgi:dephospho-CoA kinase